VRANRASPKGGLDERLWESRELPITGPHPKGTIVQAYLLTLMLAHGCDATTTAMSLNAGGHEAFPLLSQSLSINVAQQASITVAEYWALGKLAGEHPKAAKVLAMVSIGLHVAAAAQNLRAYHQMRR
jgi:hypothetical protein